MNMNSIKLLLMIISQLLLLFGIILKDMILTVREAFLYVFCKGYKVGLCKLGKPTLKSLEFVTVLKMNTSYLPVVICAFLFLFPPPVLRNTISVLY